MNQQKTKVHIRELRELRGLTQEQLSESLGINQSALSKVENQRDIHISNLVRYTEAIGGKLSILVELSGQTFEIVQFDHR